MDGRDKVIGDCVAKVSIRTSSGQEKRKNVLLTSFAWLSKPIALTMRDIMVVRRRKGGKSILRNYINKNRIRVALEGGDVPKDIGHFITVVVMVAFAASQKEMFQCLLADIDSSEDQVDRLSVNQKGFQSCVSE